MELPTARSERIEELRRRIAAVPTSAAPTHIQEHAGLPRRQPALPVPAPLAELLPDRGIRKGSIVHAAGATSLQAGLIASATAAGRTAALVGCTRLALLAAVEMGTDLRKCALVPNPGDDPIGVVSVLLDGIDLVILNLAGAAVPPTRARSITARVRRHGGVLVVVEGTWPRADLSLEAEVVGYRGLGQGHGRVRGIELDVEAIDHAQRPRRARVCLSGRDGAVHWERQDPAAIPARPMRTAAL